MRMWMIIRMIKKEKKEEKRKKSEWHTLLHDNYHIVNNRFNA